MNDKSWLPDNCLMTLFDELKNHLMTVWQLPANSRGCLAQSYSQPVICFSKLNESRELWLTRHLKVLRSDSSTPTHFEWKRDWQRVHSKSGKPEAPGQCGVQGSAGISGSASSVISSISDCCLLSSSFSSVSSSEI